MNTKITKKTQYAIAAMLELGKIHNDFVSIMSISNSQCIDHNYMGLILLKLKRKNLVLSERGVKGGYKLARPINSISISEIIEAVGEKLTITRCKNDIKNCTNDNKKCIAHYMWKLLEDKIEKYFASITLYDVLQGKLNNDIF